MATSNRWSATTKQTRPHRTVPIHASGKERSGVSDAYSNYAELARDYQLGVHYTIEVREQADAQTAVITPHGGSIEPGTSEIVEAIAGAEYSMYRFEGKLKANNRNLHITSHHFDEPRCLALIKQHEVILAIHGCVGKDKEIYIGGRDHSGRQHLAARLAPAGYEPILEGHAFPGLERDNICNRGASGKGIQLELSRPLRDAMDLQHFAATVREALATLPRG